MGISYSEVIYKMKELKDKFNLRKKMVLFAKEHGIRPARREFECSRNTVRKWLRRYNKEGNEGLKDRSKAPKNVPNKMSKEEEEKIIEARKESNFGPQRLRDYYDIDRSDEAIYRVLKENDLVNKRKKKYEKKQDLRAIKKQFKAFERIGVDVKHLKDIPNYWPQMRRYDLPKYQYTARDIKTGALFLGFAKDYGVTYSKIFIKKLIEHLEKHGISPKEIFIQTDNGPEFSGNLEHHDHGFVKQIRDLGASHISLPPNKPNYNSDVETVHHWEEQEFFNLESFKNIEEFYIKARTYQYFWNYGRYNYYKNKNTPLELLSKEVGGRKAVYLLDFYPKILSLENKYFDKKMSNINFNYTGQHLTEFADFKSGLS